MRSAKPLITPAFIRISASKAFMASASLNGIDSSIASLNFNAICSIFCSMILKIMLLPPNIVVRNAPAAAPPAFTYATMLLMLSAACSLMLSKAILNASPNSPSFRALSASVNPPIAFDAPVRISPSFMPAPAASNRVNRSVASSSAGAMLSSSPAANSKNLPFATFMLSEMLSKAPALRSITPGMLPSWSCAVFSSPEKSASRGKS